MDRLTRTIFHADAVFDFAFGVLMLLSPWIGGVFRALDLPSPQPELYTQFCGGLLVVCAYLLWISPARPALARPVGLSIGLVNALGALLLVGWVLSGSLGTGMLGSMVLLAAAVVLVVFAVVELRYARRSV
jgi:hypothetical protein